MERALSERETGGSVSTGDEASCRRGRGTDPRPSARPSKATAHLPSIHARRHLVPGGGPEESLLAATASRQARSLMFLRRPDGSARAVQPTAIDRRDTHRSRRTHNDEVVERVGIEDARVSRSEARQCVYGQNGRHGRWGADAPLVDGVRLFLVAARGHKTHGRALFFKAMERYMCRQIVPRS